MAIFPIHAATDGLIRTVVPSPMDTLAVGVRGLLWEYDVTPGPGPDPEPPLVYPGGGGKSKGKGKARTYKNYKQKKREDLKFDFIRQEDEEIMIIIKTFMKCQ